MVFPVVMYGCESWTVKKAKRRRIDAFELWCWRRLLRVPWAARTSNQSILKEISPGISLEGMILKLKLQNLGHLMWRVDSLEKTLMLRGIGGTWLIMQWSCTYHVLLPWVTMHWSRNWSCTDHLAYHALIMWLIMCWSCLVSHTDRVPLEAMNIELSRQESVSRL